MDVILLTLGDRPVTVLEAIVAGFGLIVLLLALVLFVAIRGQRGRGADLEAGAAREMAHLREGLTSQIADRDTRIRELDSRLQAQLEANTQLQARNAELKASMAEQLRHAEANYERLKQVRQQMTDEFKLVSTDLLKAQTETLSRQNKEQVGEIVKPLNERIAEFQKGLIEDRTVLKEQIGRLREDSLRMSTEATNLTRALKTSAQTQGNWGEMILSTILERSGLREGDEYHVQRSHSLDGSRIRTDAEVRMPNDDVLVIDSKVSLTAFESYANAEDEETRAAHLRDHVISVRNHIRTLAGKDYPGHAGTRISSVVMFMPIEPAFAAAVGADQGLMDFARESGIALTTPSTLMLVLQVVRNLWVIDRQHQNAEEIANRAGKLYDKVHGFLTNMDRLEEHLARARRSYDEAKAQLNTGSGNVVRQIELLRELGAKTSKELPPGWNADGEATEPQSLRGPGDLGD